MGNLKKTEIGMNKFFFLFCLSLHSICGFSQWTALPSGTTNDLLSVYFTNSNTGYAIGLNGTILKTINGGISWVSIAYGTTSNLNSVCFVDANIGYIVGNEGTIKKTTDGGTHWTTIASGTNIYIISVYFSNTDTGYVVGGDFPFYNGTILKTTNGGNTDRHQIRTSGTYRCS